MLATLQVYCHGPDDALPIDEQPHHVREDVLQAQALIKAKLLPLLESGPQLFYDVHIYVDTWNAPPEAVGTTILRLATELRAAAVVLATNDQPGWDPMRLGSVSKWMLSQSQGAPIALVRKTKLPNMANKESDGAASAAGKSAPAPAEEAAE